MWRSEQRQLPWAALTEVSLVPAVRASPATRYRVVIPATVVAVNHLAPKRFAYADLVPGRALVLLNLALALARMNALALELGERLKLALRALMRPYELPAAAFRKAALRRGFMWPGRER